jgi:hypothetical protein
VDAISRVSRVMCGFNLARPRIYWGKMDNHTEADRLPFSPEQVTYAG